MAAGLTTQGGEVLAATMVAGSLYAELMTAMFDLRWMVLLIAVMVASDFVLGLTASVRLRGEDFRFSRAGRRTGAKLMEHYQYLLWGLLIGKAILEPLGVCNYVTASAVFSFFPVIWEFDSIAGHICDLHGVKVRFSVKNIIIALVKHKSPELGRVVEESAREEDNNTEECKCNRK